MHSHTSTQFLYYDFVYNDESIKWNDCWNR